MASMACMFEECPNVATFTGTFLENGSSVTVCGDHFIDFAAGTLEGMTGIPVTTLILLPPETFNEMTAAVDTLVDVPPTTSPESSEVGTDGDLDDAWHKESETYEEYVARMTSGPDGDEVELELNDHDNTAHADITDTEFHPTPAE